ncbi:MAG: hypothetical protein ACYC9M_08970 [Desulfobulbaceae bacterium]
MGIKSGITFLSGSLAVKADTLHSLTDVLSSVSGRKKIGSDEPQGGRHAQ